MINIRKVNERDLSQISLLFAQFGEGAPDLEQMMDIFNNYKENPDYLYICAEEDGQIVGSITGVRCYHLLTQYSPYMVLETVIVHEEHRGKGIGKKLMLKVEEIARKKACKEIMFVSSAHRKKAHKFYELLGYELDVVQGFRKSLEE
ncbi:MAG: N-acetyltransferase family protein [Halanaerobiales bacterium]